MVKPININPNVMRTGLGHALQRTDGPVLCILTPKSMRLVIANSRRFLASWEWFEETGAQPCLFLIPPFVANTLAGPASWDIVRIEVRLKKNLVSLTLHDRTGAYMVQWRWDPRTFSAPAPFQEMMSLPSDMVQTDYVHIADAVHIAAANLFQMEWIERIRRERLAMSIDFATGRLNINGQKIVAGDRKRYYFDPRLVLRGLEVARARVVSFAVSHLPAKHQAILHINSDDQWQVRCSILSLSAEETQLPAYTGRLYNNRLLSPVPAA